MIRPTARFVTHAAAALVAALAIAFAAVAWRLSGGPISLAWLTPYVADALKETDSPYQVEFADTILTWAGWDRALDIRILDVRVVGADGAVAAAAPEVAISLSARAMWRGMIAPTALEIIEPRVRLVRDAEGEIEFGLGDAGTAGRSTELLLADLLAPPDPARAMGYLERISIVRGDLMVVDKRLDMAWHAPRATVSLLRSGAGIGVDAKLLVDIAGRSAKVGVRARYRGRGRDFKIWIDFADVRPEWIAADAPMLAALAAARFPVSGTFELSLDREAGLREVAFDLTAGSGRLALGAWFGEAIDIAGATAGGTLSVGADRLHIDSAVIDLGGPSIALEGVIEGFDGSPFIAAGVTVTDLPVDDLGRYWPVSLAPDARDWVSANLSAGTIRKSQTSIHLRPGDLDLARLPASAIRTTVEAAGVTVNYRDPLPNVTGAAAFGTITGDRLEMRAWGGAVAGLAADEAKLLIDDLGGRDHMTIDVAISGPLTDALRVLAHPSLGYPQRLGIDPETVRGAARMNLRFAFPLLNDLALDDVVLTAQATLSDLRVSGAFDGAELGGGPLKLSLDGAGMDLAGPVTVNAVPGEGAWRENFTDDAPFRRRYTFAGRLTDAQRRALGLPGGDYLAGPTDMAFEIVDQADGARRWRVTAGLGDTMMRIPEIYWEKRPGVDGIVELALRGGPDIPLVLESFDLAAGDLVAHGRAALDPESGVLRRVDFERLALGENDFRAALVFDDAGAYRIALKGPSLDMRPYLEDDGGEGTLPDLRVSASVDRVITRDGQSLGAVEAEVRYADGRWEAMNVDGVLAGGKRVALRIGRDAGERYFWMESGDGGEVLRTLGIYDNAIGGDLTILAGLGSEAADGAVVGELKIKNFTMRDAPLLAQILSVASLTGVFDLLTGEGLPFSRLVVPFIKRGEILEISDARAYGPAIGFTFKGRIDRAADIAELEGTLVPAYLLNSIFGKIPLLGELLVGEEGGGVFAITFQLSGPLDDPKISVNPLSALAPGVLRELFSADFDSAPDDGADQSGKLESVR